MAPYRSLCEDTLALLFDDESGKVRSEASNCFYCLEREKLGEYSGLIEAFKAIQRRLR